MHIHAQLSPKVSRVDTINLGGEGKQPKKKKTLQQQIQYHLEGQDGKIIFLLTQKNQQNIVHNQRYRP